MSDAEKAVRCIRCGDCCKSVGIWYSKDLDNVLIDILEWHLYHGGTIIYGKESRMWGVEYPSRCRHLSEDNKCMIFETRPHVCRTRGKTSDDLRGCSGILRFKTIQEVKLCVGQQ